MKVELAFLNPSKVVTKFLQDLVLAKYCIQYL